MPASGGSQAKPERTGRSCRRLAIRIGFSLAVFLLLLAPADRLLWWAGVPWAPPARVTHDPGVSTRDVSLEFDVPFETNSFGLRSPEIPLAKPAGERRIVIAGDSFVEGLGVRAEEAFPARVGAALTAADRPVRVVNGGLRGTGPVEAARLLLQVGLRFEPDLAILAISGNDLESVPVFEVPRPEKRGDAWVLPFGERIPPPDGFLPKAFAAWLPWTSHRLRFAAQESRLRRDEELDLISAARAEAERRGIPEERVTAWVESLPPDLLAAADAGRFNRSYLAQGLLSPRAHVRMLDVPGGRTTLRLLRLLELLDGVREALAGEGVRFAVVYLPSPRQHDASIRPYLSAIGVEVRPAWLRDKSRFEWYLEDWAESREVPFRSLTESFRQGSRIAPGSLNFPLDGHWTSLGHALAAKEVAEFVRAEGLIEP